MGRSRSLTVLGSRRRLGTLTFERQLADSSVILAHRNRLESYRGKPFYLWNELDLESQKGNPGSAEMGRQVAVVLYVVAMAAVIVIVDFVFFRNRFWERLTVNIGIVLVFAAFYLRFLRASMNKAR
jgi:hypothetical protein